MAGLSETVPGPAISTEVSPAYRARTFVAVPLGGASVTVAPGAATTTDAMTAAKADVIIPDFLAVMVSFSLLEKLVAKL